MTNIKLKVTSTVIYALFEFKYEVTTLSVNMKK